MRNRFDRQLEQLHLELIEMGSLCEQVINKTCDMIKDGDVSVGKEIRARDEEIDQKEREIESLCLKLLLQQQPVAKDLRKISAALKMITDMERIGDQAADIAEIIETSQLVVPTDKIKLTEMAKATIHMVTESVDAYVKQNLDIATEVIDSDDYVDNLFVEIREELLEEMDKHEITKENGLDMLMISKYYERIGDHATNIAEWVEFSITGTHRSEEVSEA